MLIVLFWAVTLCTLIARDQHFEETYCLHLQDYNFTWHHNPEEHEHLHHHKTLTFHTYSFHLLALAIHSSQMSRWLDSFSTVNTCPTISHSISVLNMIRLNAQKRSWSRSTGLCGLVGGDHSFFMKGLAVEWLLTITHPLFCSVQHNLQN
jgi:hypothetical protein